MSLGLTATMKWWEEWQLRILVLGSLLIQFILLVAGILRRTRFRSIIWLAYVAGDALAIYALATLFSRQKLHKTDAGVKASSLEVIWVPVLLIHLGGQPTISAYSLEDNELWRRHVLTLAETVSSETHFGFGSPFGSPVGDSLTQVAVAIYSFYKWWFGDVKLLVAAVLLFILGIIKYATKPWALRNASFASLQAYSSLPPRKKKQGAVAAWWAWCTSMYVEWIRDKAEAVNKNSSREGQQECESLEEYVREATKAVQEQVEKRMWKAVQEQDIEAVGNNQEGSDDYPDWIISAAVDKPINNKAAHDAAEAGGDEDPIRLSGFFHTNYFVDVIAPYSVRLRELQSFVKLNGFHQIIKLKWYIGAKSTTMYSNLRTVYTPLGFFLHKILFPCLAIAPVVLFKFSRKDGYRAKDITVTYILFSCTCFLEWYQIIMHAMEFIFRRLFRIVYRTPLRPGYVFQYNLLSYHVRKKKPTFVMKLAFLDFLRDIVNKRWYIGEVQTALHIRIRVLRYVIFGWCKFIQGDAARYKRFNNMRGQLVLNKHKQMARIGWSVSTRFDESVLLWHIATDLCFYCRDKSPQGGAAAATMPSGEQAIRDTRSISNYMIYLLLDQPEMLIPAARSALFSIASDSIDELLLLWKGDYSALNGEECIARAIIQAAATQTEEEDTLVTRACKLAKVLMEELAEEKRCRVIHGIWIEMLCYSISRRRGFLQAKYMSDRADSLDLVWVLWAFMGMETWVERYHRLDHSEQDGGGRGQAGKGEYCVGESSSRSIAPPGSRTQEPRSAAETT